MRTKLPLVGTALIALALAQPAVACKDDCGETIIKVVDCQDEPVAGATVTIQCKSSGRTRSQTTNESGEAEFEVCIRDIGPISVTANMLRFEDTGHCDSSPCQLRLCYDAEVEILSCIASAASRPRTYTDLFSRT